jgi:hypothetical protein
MEEKWKLVQFSIIFSLLNKGQPMINYEDFLPFFTIIETSIYPPPPPQMVWWG